MGPPNDLELVRPAVPLVPSYLAFLEELAAHDEPQWPAPREENETAQTFVARLLRAETDASVHRVPQTTHWATLDDTVIGHIGLRHRLNDELAEFGGHIGYTVRPSYRGRGVAKEMLARLLRTPRAKEIGRLLLTCAPSNVASHRTILANGGVLERTIFVPRIGRETCLYWITIP